jgi:4-hydroxy-2-oxoheptanedioate aldolase
MRANTTKSKLKSGQLVFGCFVRYPDPGLVQFLSYQSWDFFVFDAEHGTIEPRDCENMARAAETNDVTPLIRVPANQQHLILRYLDVGAQGVHVPWIHTAADAANAVRFAKYQPQGVRGLAGTRAADYGQRAPYADYIRQANRETMVVAQMESPEAVANIREIVRVPGIDVIFIGPTDLSNSYGAPNDLKNEPVQQALQQITEAVVPSDKALGILVSNAETARQWQQRGARYILTTTEAVLGPACREFLRGAHAATV